MDSFLESLWIFLNSNFGLMVVGFTFTTIAGAVLAGWLDKISWQRQTRIDLYKRRYEEGIEFLDGLSRLIGQRHYQLQRFLWALKESSDKLEEIEEEYFGTVSEWNATYWMHRNKIRLLVGERHANMFLSYGDDDRDEPHSVHYSFVSAHKAVQGVKSGDMDPDSAQDVMKSLSHKCSVFQERVTYEFRKQAASLELLDVSAPEE